MPCPIDLYHGPASFLMSMPMLFQRLISAMCVPELSPREMKGAPLALMVCSAKATFLAPLMLAGSSFGPMMIKSLYITEWRFKPNPSAMNFSSASLACTKTTSASPRRAVLSAWPVPWATTLTTMPVLEQRQDPAEQTGVLRRGGGGDHDGFVLRAGGCGGDERDGRCQNDQATAGRHDVLLLVRVSRH